MILTIGHFKSRKEKVCSCRRRHQKDEQKQEGKNCE